MNTIQVKVKRGSLAHRTLSPDTTDVAVDNSLHGCEAEAGSRKFVFQVEALEGAEQSVGVSHIASSTAAGALDARGGGTAAPPPPRQCAWN